MDLIWWVILIIAGYLLGSVPLSFLIAKAHGKDLRKHGTGQTGGGNLWRTTSRKFGLAIGIYDFVKGMVIIWIAQALGLDIAQQVIAGVAVIVGHNWPVFLHFHGGRGIATTVGIVIIVPAINITPAWTAVISIGIVLIGTVIMRSSPFPVIVGAASLPVSHWAFGYGANAALAFLALFLVLVIKRLTAQPSKERIPISRGQLLLNRLLFDRDIRDRKAWMSRKSVNPQDLLDEAK